MGGKPIVRIEHNDPDNRFRDKVNHNFALLSQAASAVVPDEVVEAIDGAVADALAGDILDLVNAAIASALNDGPARFTPEGGFAVQMINDTGFASIKGTLVTTSTSTPEGFVLQTNEYDSVGVVYESGIVDGSPCYVVVCGIADVLLKDSTAASMGQLGISADTDGRMIAIANPGSGLPATDTHFKEVGHITQTVGAGTDKLCRTILHFN